MIELKGISKQYLYGERVLGIVDLTVGDGEILAVLGPEKSGKTTFLKVLAGVTDCEGDVLFDGKPVCLKTNDVIMQFNDSALFKNRNVFNNLAYPLKLRKTEKAEIGRRVKFAAELLGVTASLYLRAGGLSLTEKKRIAAARLFVRDAKVIVLDGITDGLEKCQAGKLWSDMIPLLLEKKKAGVSVIFSTSDCAEAVNIADRIVILHAGKVKQIGDLKQIYDNPESVWAAEAVDFNYNAVKAKLFDENGALKLKFENGEIKDAERFRGKIIDSYIGKTVIAGVHPEGFSTSGHKDKVKFAVRDMSGYILHTESGMKVRALETEDTVYDVPDPESAILFDECNENSIMK